MTLTCCAAGQWSQIEVCLASAQNLTHNIMKTAMLILLSRLQQAERKGCFLFVSMYVYEQTWCKIIGLFFSSLVSVESVWLHASFMSFLKCLRHACLFACYWLRDELWIMYGSRSHVWQCSAAGCLALLLGSTLRDPHHIISGEKKFCAQKHSQSL